MSAWTFYDKHAGLKSAVLIGWRPELWGAEGRSGAWLKKLDHSGHVVAVELTLTSRAAGGFPMQYQWLTMADTYTHEGSSDLNTEVLECRLPEREADGVRMDAFVHTCVCLLRCCERASSTSYLHTCISNPTSHYGALSCRLLFYFLWSRSGSSVVFASPSGDAAAQCNIQRDGCIN